MSEEYDSLIVRLLESKKLKVDTLTGQVYRLVKSKNTYLPVATHDHKGYNRFHMCGATLRVNRVVFIAASGIPAPGLVIDHKNRVRNDDRIENLRAITQQQNIEGTFVGESNNAALLTESDVMEIIRIRNEERISFTQISTRYGVSPTTVNDIFGRRCWTHITNNIDVLDTVILEPDGSTLSEDGTKKWCNTCEKFLPLNCFGKNRTTPTGLHYTCKECRKDNYKKTDKR